jgi:hydrogenase maturation factor
MNERYCQAEHCITCSDEAREVRVLQIDQGQATALVELDSTTDEVDISLVEHVIPGDLLLVHGGVAIARLEEGNHE